MQTSICTTLHCLYDHVSSLLTVMKLKSGSISYKIIETGVHKPSVMPLDIQLSECVRIVG